MDMELAQALDSTTLELGFQCLKEKQIEAITSYVEEKDTFVSLPTSLVPRLSKSARGGEEAESLVSAVYACASFTQILGKPYSVRASSVSKTSSLVM